MTDAIQVSTATAAPRRSRIEAFDSVRGIYVLIIAGIHLLTNLQPTILAQSGFLVVRTFLSGTVAFVTMSGFMAGYAFEARPEREATIKSRYRGHALKVALAHPIILIALYDLKRLAFAGPGITWRCSYITDTYVALFLIVVPLLPRLGANARVLTGGASILVSRLLYVLHPGHSVAAVLLMDILAGVHPHGTRVLYENYALLSLGGMFLIGSRLGMGFARAQALGRQETMARRYVLTALPLFGLGVGMIGAWAILRHGSHEGLRAALYPDYYLPLYPIHLGVMLLLIALLLRTHWLPAARHFVAVIGRKSLVVYVAQYFVVQWLPYALGIHGHMTVPGVLLYLPGAILVLQLTARAFERSFRWDTLATASGPSAPMPSVRVAPPLDPPDRPRAG